MVKNKGVIKGRSQKHLPPLRNSSRSLLLYSLTFFLTFLFIAAPVFAAQIRVAWDPNSEPDLAGYRVYCATASGSYGTPSNAGTATTYTVTGLTAGQTYYLAVKAYDSSNNESGFSNEVSGMATDPGSVTVATNPSGLQIVVDGTTYTSPQTFTWAVGSSHTLAVSSPLSGPAGTRYAFSSWSDGGAQTHSIIAPSSSATYTANFTTQYSLTTAPNPTNGGTVSPAGTNWYNSGQSVSLSATGSSGYAFTGWSGSLSGSPNPSPVTMDAAKTIAANFFSPGVLTISPATGLSSSGTQGGPFIPSSQTYTLQNIGGTSINWSASKGQTWLSLSATAGTLAPSATATVTASINSNANGLGVGSYSDTIIFSNATNGAGNTNRGASLSVMANTFAYTITTSPSGLQVIVDGATYTTPRTFNWTVGSSHNLSVSNIQGGTNGVRYVFSSWSDGGAQAHSITTPAGSSTSSASFTTQYSLTAASNPSNGGNVDPAGTTWHNRGQIISVMAAVNSGFSFQGWAGSLSGTKNPESVIMDAPKTASANFNPKTLMLHPSPGVYNKGSWRFDNNGNGLWEGCETDTCISSFGGGKDFPVLGDWSGDGSVKLGVYRNSGQWILDLNGNGLLEDCQTDLCVTFGGSAGDIPVVGDWTGNKIAKIGVYRGGKWLLDADGSGTLDNCVTDLCIDGFGGSRGDVPVVGDWNGDGKDKIGIYRSGKWILDKNGNGLLEDCTIDLCFENFGEYRGDIPVVGDWNNDGREKIGIYRTGQWLLDYNGDGAWDGCESDVCIEALGGSRGDVAIVARHPKTF